VEIKKENNDQDNEEEMSQSETNENALSNLHIGLKQSYVGYQHIVKRTHTIDKMKDTSQQSGLKRARTMGNLLVDKETKKTPVPGNTTSQNSSTTGDKENVSSADVEKINDNNGEVTRVKSNLHMERGTGMRGSVSGKPKDSI